jgi:hypothetical protein
MNIMSGFSFLNWLRGKKRRQKETRRRREKTRFRPQVEGLEERLTPTVVFDPVFGKETPTASAPYSVITGTAGVEPVYLIFWGSTWNTTNATGESILNKEYQAILSSPDLSLMNQYGSVATAQYAGTYVDTSAVNANFSPGNNVGASLSAANAEITKVINTAGSGIAAPTSGGNLQNEPIYDLITDPNGPTAGNNTNGGYNTGGTYTTTVTPINIISMGTQFSDFNNFIPELFSHEMSERLTDPVGGGLQLNPGPTLPTADPAFGAGPYQVADGEPEPGGQSHYGYRLFTSSAVSDAGNGGVMVQPVWSNNTNDINGLAGAWAVNDGNSQVVFLNPIWQNVNSASPTFSNGNAWYNLVINGDQLGANDSITLAGVNASDGINGAGTGILLTFNGQKFYFDPNTINNISVNGLTGSNTLTLDFTNGNFISPGGLTFNGGTGPQGTLVLKGGSFTNEVDTATGPHAGTYSLDGSIITYSNLAPIVDTASATKLTIKDPKSGDTVTFQNDPGSPQNGFATSEINGSGFEKVDFANKANVVFDDTSNGSGEVYNILAPLVNGASLTIVGSGTGSSLHAPANQAVTWNITGHNSGNLPGYVKSFSNIQYLFGGAQSDEFVFFPGGSIDGYILGGPGFEWVDYEHITTSVVVNLGAGKVPGVAIGAFNVNNAIGSAVGGDTITGSAAGGVLVTHGSGNTLHAGAGRSVLIGGNGKNTIFGGASDDLIIDGSTVFDSNIGVLDFFNIIWQDPLTFATRLTILQGFLIVGNTVTLSSAGTQGIGPRFGRGGSAFASSLVGNGGQNWFFTININSIVDFKSGIDQWTN